MEERMSTKVKHVANAHCSDDWDAAGAFGVEQAKRVRAFHASIPSYRPTPLRRLDGLAGELGIDSLHVKDESARFGLNAFKGLGGSYAVACYIAGELGIEL
jgi:diaminopropionate ammonia-lyase